MGIRIVDFMTVLASLATIAAIVGPAIRYLQRKDRDPKVIGGTIGAIVVVIIAAVLVSSNFDISYHGKTTIDAPPVFGFASSTATPSATVTRRPTTAPLPTATPNYATLPMMMTGQYSENIRLALACSSCDENLLTTITTVAFDDTAENMTWTLSFYNHTAHGCNEVYFNSLVLEDPSGDRHQPAGPAMDWPGISIDAGKTQQMTLAFPFLPRSSASYTLTGNLQCNHTGFTNGEFANDYGPQQLTF